MRTGLILAMVAPWVVAALVLPILTVTYRRFRRVVPEIRTADDMDRLRSLAKLQMYLSLLAHPLLTIPLTLVVWVFGWLIANQLGWLDLLIYGVGAFAAFAGITMLGNSPAEMAQSIPTPDGDLASERDRVVDVWINRFFPDW